MSKDQIEFLKKHVVLEENVITSTFGMDYPGTYESVDESKGFDLEEFKKNFQIKLIKCTKEKLEFDMIGVDVSVANAIRRILIAEVPTMAIEKVFVMNNTSFIHDEILVHRLGLIPIYADPRKFHFKTEEEDPTDLNTIVFQLTVKCEKKPDFPQDSADPKSMFINSSVYSSQLKWIPQGDQEEVFADNPIKPVHDDILIAKLRPGQEIDVQLHCEKGIGKTHAKWSPVSTASYRLMPHITLLEEIKGELAEKLQSCFSPGVIELVDVKGEKVARVANPRNDTMSREVFRHPELADKVRIARKRDHFIFSIETTGALPPEVLLREAIQIFINKIQTVKSSLAKLLDPDMNENTEKKQPESTETEDVQPKSKSKAKGKAKAKEESMEAE